jgi:hypothetical protein
MGGDAELGLDRARLQVIATVAPLLCRERRLPNEYVCLENGSALSAFACLRASRAARGAWSRLCPPLSATGDVWMYLFGRPPALAPRTSQKRTPASVETGVTIGLVAGAGSAALEKMRTRRWVWELPFERLGRALDAMWEEARLWLAAREPSQDRA